MPENSFGELGIEKNEGVGMNRAQEILDTVVPLYETLPEGLIEVNCGDGRRPVEAGKELFAKKFGGGPGYSWDYMVLTELARPGSVQKPLPETHEELVSSSAFKRAGLSSGVHSDEHAEGHNATSIDTEKTDGPVGCGRWQRGQEISQAALEHIEEIVTKGKEIAPELFNGREERAHQIAQTNAELAKRRATKGRPILPSGREIVVAALKVGDSGVVLEGDHEEKDASYNLVENQTNDTYRSQEHFGADGWATSRFFEANDDEGLFDPTDVLLQDVIISMATKKVLAGSLDNIVVRVS